MYALHFFAPTTRSGFRPGALNERGMMDDKLMRRTLIDALDGEPIINSARIGVAVENGVVTLTGQVGSRTQRLAAEEAVRGVRGVRGVVAQIQIRPGGKNARDDETAYRARVAIAWHARTPDGVVKVQVTNGWVTLTGTVEDAYERRRAEAAVRKLDGVVGITNLLEIRATSQEAAVPVGNEDACAGLHPADA